MMEAPERMLLAGLEAVSSLRGYPCVGEVAFRRSRSISYCIDQIHGSCSGLDLDRAAAEEALAVLGDHKATAASYAELYESTGELLRPGTVEFRGMPVSPCRAKALRKLFQEKDAFAGGVSAKDKLACARALDVLDGLLREAWRRMGCVIEYEDLVETKEWSDEETAKEALRNLQGYRGFPCMSEPPVVIGLDEDDSGRELGWGTEFGVIIIHNACIKLSVDTARADSALAVLNAHMHYARSTGELNEVVKEFLDIERYDLEKMPTAPDLPEVLRVLFERQDRIAKEISERMKVSCAEALDELEGLLRAGLREAEGRKADA